jgi:plastocyanin
MRTARALIVGALATLAACGGDDGDDGGTAPAVFTTLAVEPTSANLVVGGTQTITTTARDQNGGTMSGLTTTYTAGSQAIASVTNAGVITGVAVGTTTITASGTVGSVTKTATVNVTVALPGATASVAATADNKFNPTSVTVTRNGVVTWTFAAQHNVTFDTQGAPANIPNQSTGTASATFPTAGTFAYHCTIHGTGMSGSVEVK